VHRDIKPSNIMLGNYGDVYLLDWGVAKHAQQTVTDGVVQSSPAEPAFAGGVIGTPRTMAPEQAAGGNVDARADVYALGAVLFEILTLHPLHPEGGFDTVLPAILAGVDARPSVRYPEREVAPELEDLCVRATKLHASERMESALALSQGIESFLDGDRDLQLRRDGAQKHATLAKDLADAVLAPAAGDGAQRERERTRALREVGKALALDAHNAVALGTLVRLLTTPPAQAPREVLAEQLQVQRRHLRIAGVALSIVYAYISLNALATWSLGVRNMSAVVVAHVLWGLALAAAVVTAVRPRYLPLFASCFFGVTTCAYLTSVYSPLLPIVPTLLVVHGVLFAFVGQMRLRLAMIAYTALAWTFSSFAATLGLLPQTVRFEGGDITIHSNVIDLPASGIPVYMYAAVMAMLVAPAVLVGRLRGAYQRSDDAMRLQAWQLRQLVSNDEGQPLGPTVRG
jgi:serine/threonine-protein kinase